MRLTARLTLVAIGGAVSVALLWLLVTAVPSLSRPGFSADEELTAIVVSSSRLIGIPALPSGVVYLRGAAYVTLSGIAGAIGGRDLASYRFVSLMFGLVNIVLIALVATKFFEPPAAAIAAVLLASSSLHAALSAFARPYTAAMACFLLIWLTLPWALRSRRGEAAFLALVAVSQAVHEAELLLILIPLSLALTLERGDSRLRPAVRLTAETAALAAGLQALFAAGFSASLSRHLGVPDGLPGVFVLRQIPWPPLEVIGLAGVAAFCVALAVLGGLAFWLWRRLRLSWLELASGVALAVLFQLGLLVAITLVGILARPARLRAYVAACLLFGLASAVGWTVHTTMVTDAALSPPLFTALVQTSLSYPFDWALLAAGWFPLAALCVAAATFVAAIHDATPERRAVAVVTWLVLIAFGAARIPGVDRYLAFVLPAILLLSARAIALGITPIVAAARQRAPEWLAVGIAAFFVVGATAALAAEQRARTTSVLTTFGGDSASKDCMASVPASDLLVCNDEPACRYLVQRVDAWLLPDAELRRGFAARRDGVAKGLYAGSLILEDQMALTRFIEANPARNVTVMLLDTPKFGYAEQDAIARQAARGRNVRTRTCGSSVTTVRFEP